MRGWSRVHARGTHRLIRGLHDVRRVEERGGRSEIRGCSKNGRKQTGVAASMRASSLTIDCISRVHTISQQIYNLPPPPQQKDTYRFATYTTNFATLPTPTNTHQYKPNTPLHCHPNQRGHTARVTPTHRQGCNVAADKSRRRAPLQLSDDVLRYTCINTRSTSDKCINTGSTSDKCISTGSTSDKCINTGSTSDNCINTGSTSDKCINTCSTSDKCISTGSTSDTCSSHTRLSSARSSINTKSSRTCSTCETWHYAWK